MKFKHHLNEQNMAHFILLWLVLVTLGYFTPLAVAHHYPPTPPPTSPFTLFTDYLTIRVLNKNEVRKWFEDYRSCRTCWTATKIFCEGGSNKWEPREKREKKRKEKGVCAFQNTFTQLWIFGYKVHVFTTATVPVPPPTYPVSGKPMEN